MRTERFTKAQFFPHYESVEKLLRKRYIDRYREPQQRFTKPQTRLYTIRDTMYTMYTRCIQSQHQQSGVRPTYCYHTSYCRPVWQCRLCV